MLRSLYGADLWPIPVSRGLSDYERMAYRATDELLKVIWGQKQGRFKSLR